MRCINCGKDSEKIVCPDCLKTVDLEQLCRKIIDYNPESGNNELWNEMAEGLEYKSKFRWFASDLAEFLESPLKEYWQIETEAGNSSAVAKEKRQWLYDTAPVCLKSSTLSEERRNRVHGLVLDSAYKDYQWDMAEKMAVDLSRCNCKNKYVLFTMGIYYTQTRRYEIAEEIFNEAIKIYQDDPYKVNFVQKLEDCRQREEHKKREYVPQGAQGTSKEEKEKLKNDYFDFLKRNGIDVETNVPKQNKKAIPADRYPQPREVKVISGDTFVAFDVETTNRNAKTTSATEIGAIRVVNGKIDESASFVFQEIVHPIDSKISPEVEELTGITNDMVKDARKIKEVFNDFADFIGDDVLVGYNCISFDSKVITRSGRYAERVIENPYYEVLYPARKYKKDNNLENARLETVSEALGIKVTEAHRALADAITTARVYLKLKELGYTKDSDSVDELLDDEDLW